MGKITYSIYGMTISLILAGIYVFFIVRSITGPTKPLIPILGIMGVTPGVYYFFTGIKKYLLKRLIEKTVTSKISSVTNGFVEVYGEVVPAEGEMTKGPYSNKACVYCEYRKEMYIPGGRRRGRWSTIEHGTKSVPFFLKDDTGHIIIDSRGAKVEIPKDFRVGNDLRFTEHIIEAGDKLYVLGTAVMHPSGQGMVIQKGKKAYYIFDNPETEIVATLKWNSLSGIIGGGMIMFGAIAQILVVIGTL